MGRIRDDLRSGYVKILKRLYHLEPTLLQKTLQAVRLLRAFPDHIKALLPFISDYDGELEDEMLEYIDWFDKQAWVTVPGKGVPVSEQIKRRDELCRRYIELLKRNANILANESLSYLSALVVCS